MEYMEVPKGLADVINPDVRPKAEKAAEIARTLLGINQEVKIRWFVDTDWSGYSPEHRETLEKACKAKGLKVFEREGNVVGMYWNDGDAEIWLRVGLGGLEQAKTVAHEMRHLWQYLRWGDNESDAEKQTREIDAANWAGTVWGQLSSAF